MALPIAAKWVVTGSAWGGVAPATTLGIRGRAVSLVGFAGSLRRGELVGIDLDDLQRRAEGIAIRERHQELSSPAR
jgi:hypothetical protein